jgi:hypothetical protein
MIRDEHIRFIESKLSELMHEIVVTINLLGDGLEFYAASEYMLQSLLLRMTGAQEQKMKCICWELATDDLTYRYKRYYQKWELGECSTLVHKTAVFGDLLNGILAKEPTYKLFPNSNDKILICDHILMEMNGAFQNTNIAKVYKTKYEEFLTIWGNLSASNITCGSPNEMFHAGRKENTFYNLRDEEYLYVIYKLMYQARNRYAHNAVSYQLNLPRFYEINDDMYQKFNNIFLFYAELLLIDEIFRTLFEKYKSVVEFA